MRIIEWEDFLSQPFPERSMAATIGVFDGFHIGHRRLVGKVVEHSQTSQSAVFTFRENPKKLLHPASYHGDLASLEQKLESFETLGLDLAVLIDFSGNFSKLAGRDFLALLRDRGNLVYVAVGSNFRCGHRLDTDADSLREFYTALGVSAEILEPVLWAGHPVSSSRVRLALREGRLEEATAMLARPYELDLGRMSLIEEGKDRAVYALSRDIVLPPPGRYEVACVGSERKERAFLDIGEGRAELGGFDARHRPRRVLLQRLYKETKR